MKESNSLHVLSLHHWMTSLSIHAYSYPLIYTRFNHSHTFMIFVHFTEISLYTLPFGVCTLLLGFGFKGSWFCTVFIIIYQIFNGTNFYLCRYGICLSVYYDNMLCFRQGSKVEQFH